MVPSVRLSGWRSMRAPHVSFSKTAPSRFFALFLLCFILHSQALNMRDGSFCFVWIPARVPRFWLLLSAGQAGRDGFDGYASTPLAPPTSPAPRQRQMKNCFPFCFCRFMVLLLVSVVRLRHGLFHLHRYGTCQENE